MDQQVLHPEPPLLTWDLLRELQSVHNDTGYNTTEDYNDHDKGADEYGNYPATTLELILPRTAGIVSLLAVICVAVEAWGDWRASSRNSTSNTRAAERLGWGNASSKRQRRSTTTRQRPIPSTTRQNNSRAVTRIQLLYQIPLFCHALMFALGTAPAPQHQGIWGAFGTIRSCEAQGFLFQFAIHANVGWDMALTTSYLIMARYPFLTRNLLDWETIYHIMIWPIALAVSIYPLSQNMYNINHMLCWVESYPNNCDPSDGDTTTPECMRGAGASLWASLSSLVIIFHLLFSIAMMICIYCSIRRIENRSPSAVFGGTTPSTTNTGLGGTAARSSGAVNLSGSGGDLSSSSSDEEECEAEENDAQQPTAETGASQALSVASSRARTTASGITTNTLATRIATNRKYSRAVGTQGMWYAAGMSLTTLPIATYVAVYNITGYSNDTVRVLCASSLPLVGYVNFFVFMRLRTPDKCHTRYAKALRWMHSWIWDSRKGDDSDDENGTPKNDRCCCLPSLLIERPDGRHPHIASVSIPKSNSGEGDLRPPIRSHATPLFPQLALIREDDGTVEEESSSRSFWTGTIINADAKSKDMMVSELMGSEFETTDITPSRPVRLRSEAETAAPPVLPRREVSCISEVDEDNLSGGTLGDESSSSSKKLGRDFLATPMEAPPTKPIRLESWEIMPFETSTEEISTKPVRLESSCIDDSEESNRIQAQQQVVIAASASRRQIPPMQPIRPVRLESACIDDSEESQQSPTQYGANDAAAGARGRQQQSLPRMQQPVIPLCFESPCIDDPEESPRIRTQQPITRAPSSKESAPTLPMRFVSEVER